MSLTDNLHPPTKNFFFECRLEDLLCLLRFDQVHSTYRSGEILAQSHVHFGVFFRKYPKVPTFQSVKQVQCVTLLFCRFFVKIEISNP